MGVNATMHDPAACLVKDGQLLWGIEEERLTRYKFEKGRPKRAIEKCLDLENIGLGSVDYIGYTWRPWVYLFYETAYRLSRILKKPVESIYGLVQAQYITQMHLHDLWYFRKVCQRNVVVLDHHMAHAAATFFGSPFERAAILGVDNRGEAVTTMLSVGEGNNIRPLKRIRIQHSLGKFYSGMTYHLGFRAEHDEYKVMGLASYGQPKYYDILKRAIRFDNNGGFKLDYSLCNVDLDGRPTDKLIASIGPKRDRREKITQQHMDLAASLQKVTEEAVLYLADYLHKISGEENLCLTGGVAYNSVANGRIERESRFRNFYTPPCVGDSGAAIGTAMYIHHVILNRCRMAPLDNAYLGLQYDDGAILACLETCKVRFKKCDNIAKTTAKLLADGNIMGWFQGKMEFGPRALGARSILADPRRAEMKDLVNKYVKRREEFRPFAPSVLEESVYELFDAPCLSPFMTSVCNVHEDKRKLMPAVTHFDGTARIQTVSRKTNPIYWEMINEFKNITGVPVVLNTSFNVRDEPIVCSPLDAIACFCSSGMDYLAIGNYLVAKDKEIPKE